MALRGYKATIGAVAPDLGTTADPSGLGDTTAAVADVATLVSGKPDVTAVDTAVGVLVADGASPTQAHVNDLNTAWGTLKTAITTNNTNIDTTSTDMTVLAASVVLLQAAIGGDVTVLLNPATVTTKRQLVQAIRDYLLPSIVSSGLLAE